MSDLNEQVSNKRGLAEAVCRRLSEEIGRLGFSAEEKVSHPVFDEAEFELVKDPFTGAQNLAGYWLDESGKQRIGRLQFNSDDSFYAEYDVVKPHPADPKRFVEGVSAWGKADNIKAEAKLLDMPE